MAVLASDRQSYFLSEDHPMNMPTKVVSNLPSGFREAITVCPSANCPFSKTITSLAGFACHEHKKKMLINNIYHSCSSRDPEEALCLFEVNINPRWLSLPLIGRAIFSFLRFTVCKVGRHWTEVNFTGEKKAKI
jgi:hypothetical protein